MLLQVALILASLITETDSQVGHYSILNSHVLRRSKTYCKEFASNPSVPITVFALKVSAGPVM
jgi:hypothetical protein